MNISPVLIRRNSRGESSKRLAVPFDVHRLFVEEGFDFVDDIIWVKPVHDYRRFGYRIKRGTENFTAIYRKRVAVERVNSRLKDKRRLDSHCFRGLQKMNLHCTMSVLAMNAMALAKIESGESQDIRSSTRKVA